MSLSVMTVIHRDGLLFLGLPLRFSHSLPLLRAIPLCAAGQPSVRLSETRAGLSLLCTALHAAGSLLPVHAPPLKALR